MPMTQRMEHSVGIDLGTTNSAVARVIGSDPVVLETEPGHRTVPSVVQFDEDGDVLVGRKAKNTAVQYPNRTIESVKRKMGDDEPVAQVGRTEYLPEEVSAMILEKLKAAAERELGSSVTNAVVTVPAYFSNREREATKRACKLAGLTSDRIINEPTAAMLAHEIRADDEIRALVYDLGGGTFDVSIVDAADGVFQVIATEGLSHHGGDDWDARLYDQIVRIVEEDTGRSVEEIETQQRIWDAAREAKHELSSKQKTTIEIPFLFSDPRYDFSEEITRRDFEEMTDGLLEETITVCQRVLDEAGVRPRDLDQVLMVGGSTRMPQVSDRLAELFGDKLRRSQSPDEIVAEGAAIQAAIINESLPVVDTDGSTTLERKEKQSVEIQGQSSYGLPDTYDEVVLIDVLPRSLGVFTEGDEFSKIIERNTTVPTEQTERYYTIEDNQTRVQVKVYQGESPVATDNRFLAEFTLPNLPPLPAGEAAVDVTFRINEDCILEVTAQSVQRGHSEQMTVEREVEFSERELQQMRSNLPEVKE